MSENTVPDSWEAGDKSLAEAEARRLRNLSLNVDAPVFIPGAFRPAAQSPPKPTAPATVSNNAPVKQEAPVVEKVEKSEEKAEPVPTVAEASAADASEPAQADEWTEEDAMDDDEGFEGGEAGDEESSAPRAPISNAPKKQHVNIVFCGHVDAGKSTIGGHIMYLTGMVDKRTLEKYEREAKEKNRESWYLSWALDTNIEERDKGKTVEVGRGYFETETKHFTILDAPGHKCFVPNMIGGASQADIAVLVISARKGEFETGFEKGGQTREHAMLVKTAGVKHLVVLVNKMDDPTVNWDEGRYNEIKEKLTPYLKKVGFTYGKDIFYIPCSGFYGHFLKDPPIENICPWYSGPCLIPYLDVLPSLFRNADGPVRLSIVDRYRDMGTVVLGKLESGTITQGMRLTLMPNKDSVEVLQLWSDEEEVMQAASGESLKLKLKGVEEEDISPGFVLCDPNDLCHVGKVFDAQVVIVEHKSIICPGYTAVMHIQTCAEEVTLRAIICLLDKKTGDKTQQRPRFIKQDQAAIVRFEIMGGVICLEPFKVFPAMGRFTLRDEGKTIAIGKVLKVMDSERGEQVVPAPTQR